LDEAKISVFKNLDAPRAVSEEGMARFMSGITEEMRETQRARLLDVDVHQVKEVAQQFVVEPLEKGEGKMVFLGPKKEWVDGGWMVKDMEVSKGA